MSDQYEWFPATNLPSPGIPLLLAMANGDIIHGIRPDHVLNRDCDPDYRDMHGNRLKREEIVKWAIK